jgi:hypothetical protein
MGSKSDAYEVEILKMTTYQNSTLPAAVTAPGTGPWIALFTTAPTDSSAGVEVSVGAYARVDSKGKWAVPAAGSVANNAVITFPTASADWGTITAFAVCTAVTAGTQLMWGTLTANKAVNNGDTASFAAGALTLTED